MTENRNENFYWNKSRQTLNRLFEGYCKDYGPEAGGKIIHTIIDVLGGSRLTIPEKISNNPDNITALIALYSCLCENFGQASGEAIMRKFIMELKGSRISFPDYEDLYREIRDRKIKSMYPAYSYNQLAVMFNLSKKQIWQILSDNYDRHGKVI